MTEADPAFNLARVLDIAKSLKVSREAVANRYVTTHDDTIVIVFSKNDKIRYIAKKDEFPWTLMWKRERLPHTLASASNGLSDITKEETDVWLVRPKTEYLNIQT